MRSYLKCENNYGSKGEFGTFLFCTTTKTSRNSSNKYVVICDK